MKINHLKKIDWIVIFSSLALVTIGLFAIYSATYNEQLGSSTNFNKQLSYYSEFPELFRANLHTETIRRVHTNSVDKLYLPHRELRMQLSREPQSPKKKES